MYFFQIKMAGMTPKYIIAKKRDGQELTNEEIDFFVKSLITNDVTQAQLGAFLMAVVLNGLSRTESANLTRAMLDTGFVFEWPEEWKPSLVDKHSTGGVGDKISLVLAPALAACGRKVPMVSGRGLGITGGTLDKLESIKGFNVDQSYKSIIDIVDKVGCCIVSPTGDIAPADKVQICRDNSFKSFLFNKLSRSRSCTDVVTKQKLWVASGSLPLQSCARRHLKTLVLWFWILSLEKDATTRQKKMG